MAAKLTSTQINQLKAVGIVGVSTEEAAKDKLIKFLGDHDVDNVDDESLIDLINMADAFFSPESSSDAEEEVLEEEEDLDPDALANEVEELEEDEVAVKAPAKIAAKPVATKSAPAKAAPAVKKAPVPVGAAGTRFDPAADDSHLSHLDIFKEVFSEDEYDFKILKQGFTIRLKGDNALPTILNFDELRIVDDTLRGNLYTNRLKNVAELEGFLPEELLEEVQVGEGKKATYEPKYKRGMFRGESHPCIRAVTTEQVFAILGLYYDEQEQGWSYDEGSLFEVSLSRATGSDQKMGENREKMEQKLQESNAKPKGKK